MRVLLISDYSLQHTAGGAQRSNAIIVDEGRQRGHSILEYNHDSNAQILEGSYDLIISSNLENIVTRGVGPKIISQIASHPNHARLEHDANRYLSDDLRKLLFQSCKKTFFLSNFHHQNFIDSYGDYFVNVEIVPDPIDSKLFKDYGEKREDKILYVGFMHPYKGTDEFFAYAFENPELNFVVAGWASDEAYRRNCEIFPNVNLLGQVSYEEMPSLYNKYRTLFYKPSLYEPFCRSVGEALFCGIEIESNNLIGSLHFLEEVGHDQFVLQCDRAPKTFWEKIECLQ